MSLKAAAFTRRSGGTSRKAREDGNMRMKRKTLLGERDFEDRLMASKKCPRRPQEAARSSNHYREQSLD